MEAAIATLAVACLVGTGGLVTCVVFLWKLHREARRDMSSLSDTHDALLDANHNTHKATDSQLKAVQEDIDELEQRWQEAVESGALKRGAVAASFADGLRGAREKATARDASGRSRARPAGVSGEPTPGATGRSGDSD